jgi:hypothetical protein
MLQVELGKSACDWRPCEEGLRDEFFRLYERYMPEEFRVVDSDAQKVEFWLQIYFAVFPSLPSSVGRKGAAPANGEAVQLDPIEPKLKAPGTNRVKL